ncbi:MAG: PEP-CTERM sorting domain-containing protein [Verrucomicrobiaceae bacterium]
MKKHTHVLAALAVIPAVAQGSLWVDFNSTSQDGGPHPEAGYQSYDAGHENATDLGSGTTPGATASYNPVFALTGAATVTLTPDWPNTTDINVRQSIDRGPTNDATWTGSNLDLLTDFIGIDTRTSNGGNGNWDGTTGTPTYLTFNLGGLAAADYAYRSFHHDTENVWAGYTVEVSIDGGTTFSAVETGAMTSSTGGGNPANPSPTTTGSAETLASTYNTTFTANGTDDVVIRYGVLADTAVHRQILAVNGFQLSQVPEPSTGIMALLGASFLLRRKR